VRELSAEITVEKAIVSANSGRTAREPLTNADRDEDALSTRCDAMMGLLDPRHRLVSGVARR